MKVEGVQLPNVLQAYSKVHGVCLCSGAISFVSSYKFKIRSIITVSSNISLTRVVTDLIKMYYIGYLWCLCAYGPNVPMVLTWLWCLKSYSDHVAFVAMLPL